MVHFIRSVSNGADLVFKLSDITPSKRQVRLWVHGYGGGGGGGGGGGQGGSGGGGGGGCQGQLVLTDWLQVTEPSSGVEYRLIAGTGGKGHDNKQDGDDGGDSALQVRKSGQAWQDLVRFAGAKGGKGGVEWTHQAGSVPGGAGGSGTHAGGNGGAGGFGWSHNVGGHGGGGQPSEERLGAGGGGGEGGGGADQPNDHRKGGGGGGGGGGHGAGGDGASALPQPRAATNGLQGGGGGGGHGYADRLGSLTKGGDGGPGRIEIALED